MVHFKLSKNMLVVDDFLQQVKQYVGTLSSLLVHVRIQVVDSLVSRTGLYGSVIII